MDRVPLYRRPGIRTAVGLAGLILLFAWVRASAGEVEPLPSVLSAPLALLSSLALAVLIGQLIPTGRDLWASSGEILRWTAVLAWSGAHAAALLGLEGWRIYAAPLAQADLALVSLVGMVGLASQFVLPVRTAEERAAAVGRLLRFLLGGSGPVAFVRNGRPIESRREGQRHGPGVLLLDHASAAVLRTDVRFTGAAGPGLTFTGPAERIAETLDLRPQVRSVPSLSPTRPASGETLSATSLAVTRDGIPVAADLAVTFEVHPGGDTFTASGQDPNIPPYRFYPDAATRAVQGHAYSGREDVPWDRLPLLLAIDLWREAVKARDLPSLLPGGPDRPSPLSEIRQQILSRLTAPTRFEPGPDRPGRTPNREYRMLSERGLRAIGVAISNLQLPDDVREERSLRWREVWSGSIHEVLERAEKDAEARRREGRMQARQDLRLEITGGLRGKIAAGEAPGRRDTLLLLLADALRICQRGELSPEGGPLEAQLVRLRESLLALDGDCAPPEGSGSG